MNPADVQKSLGGADYPATKQELISYAKNNKAPKEIIDALNGLPNRQFTNSADVASALGGGEGGEEGSEDGGNRGGNR